MLTKNITSSTASMLLISLTRKISLPNPNLLPSPRTPLLTTTPRYSYHMSYLMDSKHEDRYVKIDRRAFHLYKDSILNFPNEKFNEKIFLLVLIDCVRTKQKYEDFEQLAEYGISKIDEFKEPVSIFNFSTQLYLYNYQKREMSVKVAQKGFWFLAQKIEQKFSSYFVMKFLIFMEKCVGLQKFPDSSYGLINFTKFKPLFLCFTLQMFYANNLQHYPTIQNILTIFTQSSSIIPFADIHHYKLSIRKIPDPKYKEFIERLERILMENRGKVEGDARKGGVEGLMGESEEEGVGLGGSDMIGDVEDGEVVGRVRKNEKGVMGMTDGNDKKNESQAEDKGNRENMTSELNTSFSWQKAYSRQIHRRYTFFSTILPTVSAQRK